MPGLSTENKSTMKSAKIENHEKPRQIKSTEKPAEGTLKVPSVETPVDEPLKTGSGRATGEPLEFEGELPEAEEELPEVGKEVPTVEGELLKIEEELPKVEVEPPRVEESFLLLKTKRRLLNPISPMDSLHQCLRGNR
jgi:hypothetical protein